MLLRQFYKSDITPEYLCAINGPQGKYLWRGEEEWTREKAVKWFCEEIQPDPNQVMMAICRDDVHIGNIKWNNLLNIKEIRVLCVKRVSNLQRLAETMGTQNITFH